MTRAAVALAALLAAGCSSLPPAPVFAGDVCTRCRRTIGDVKMAGEIIDSGGRAFKFKTPGCMAKYVTAHNPDVAAIYVADYQSGRLVKATAATYVPAMVGEGRERERDYLAFSSSRVAADAAAREHTTPLDWKALLEEVRTARP
jgi:hypothetical protein